MINFYSDTQTLPSAAMQQAAMNVATGDERHAACPTTNMLLERVADMFGMEDAVFLPSGTMCNEIAIAVHTRPGDEVICARQSHVIFAESGGPAALSGVMMQPIDAERGLLTSEQIKAHVRPPSSFAPRSRLLVTEQTSNLGGGAIWPLEQLNEVAKTAQDLNLAVHLDGARILNAQVATGIPAKDFAKHHDSAWIAFTKGLGCPVGAVLAGSKEFIKEAWLYKRRWGGAMRQTGMLTAMCLYALDHHVERLSEDHALARHIADGIKDAPIVERLYPVDSNIVLMELAGETPDAAAQHKALKQADFQVTKVGTDRLRIVTHMDVGDAEANQLIDAIQALQPTP